MPIQNAKLNKRWLGVELDELAERKKFRRALMRANAEFMRKDRKDASIYTPYWHSDFIDWLIYDCTLAVCGCVCTEKNNEWCEFEVNSSGCQTEGICLDAKFVIPTKEFSKAELAEIVPGCGEYYPARKTRVKKAGKPAYGTTFGPFGFPEKFCDHIEWWYDAYYDESDNNDNND